jgi:hypothetical protein
VWPPGGSGRNGPYPMSGGGGSSALADRTANAVGQRGLDLRRSPPPITERGAVQTLDTAEVTLLDWPLCGIRSNSKRYCRHSSDSPTRASSRPACSADKLPSQNCSTSSSISGVRRPIHHQGYSQQSGAPPPELAANSGIARWWISSVDLSFLYHLFAAEPRFLTCRRDIFQNPLFRGMPSRLCEARCQTR